MIFTCTDLSGFEWNYFFGSSLRSGGGLNPRANRVLKSLATSSLRSEVASLATADFERPNLAAIVALSCFCRLIGIAICAPSCQYVVNRTPRVHECQLDSFIQGRWGGQPLH